MRDFGKSIKSRIILAFSFCITMMAAIGAFGIYGISSLNSNMKDSYVGNIVPIVSLSEIRAAELEIRYQLRYIQALHNTGQANLGIESIRSAQERVSRSWNQYYPSGISTAKEREIAEQIRSALPQFKAGIDEAVTALDGGNYNAASALIEKQAPTSRAFNKLVSDDVELNLDQAKHFADDSGSTFRTIFWIAITMVGTGTIIGSGVSICLIRAISKPLDVAVHVANDIAAGKLDNRIEVNSHDEFGMLLNALQKMDRQLSNTVREIKTGAESVKMASGEIASGNTDLSARTEQQAASLEETASSMAELTETVKQNADNARQANGLATRATDMAEAGNEAMHEMVRTIAQISGNSTKISDITGVIEGIAFQTNILALNAAVEAARAGEQGRGFAVVASEVRGLAQRSAAAAKEIKELIGSSVTMIQDGAKQAGEVDKTMDNVMDAIRQVSNIVGEITAASDEQSRGIAQVNRAVVQMDEVTQQNAALVEQAAAAAQSLERQAESLTETVSAFRLTDVGLSAS